MADREKKDHGKGFLNRLGVERRSPIKLTLKKPGSSKSTSGSKKEVAASGPSASGHHHDNGPLREAVHEYIAEQSQWRALKEQLTKMETEAACAEKHRVEIKKIREAHDAEEDALREKLKFIYDAREEAQLKLRAAESELAKARTRPEKARHDQTRSKEQDEEVAKLHATLEEIQSSQDKAMSDLQKLQTTIIANLATSRAARQAQDAKREKEREEARISINQLEERLAEAHRHFNGRIEEAARSEEQLRASLHEAEQNAAVQGRLASEIAAKHDSHMFLLTRYFETVAGTIGKETESAMESVKRHAHDSEDQRTREIGTMKSRIATLVDLRKTLLEYIGHIERTFEKVKDKVGDKEARMFSHVFKKVKLLGEETVHESFAGVGELAMALDKADVFTREYMSSSCKHCSERESERNDARRQRDLVLKNNGQLEQEIKELKQKIEHLSGTKGGSRAGSRDRSSALQEDVAGGGVTSHHGSELAHHSTSISHGGLASADHGVPTSSVQQPHDIFAGFPNIAELVGPQGEEGQQFAPAGSDAGSGVPVFSSKSPGDLFKGRKYDENTGGWIKPSPKPGHHMALTTTRASGSGKAPVPKDKGKRAAARAVEPARPGGSRASSRARTVQTIHSD